MRVFGLLLLLCLPMYALAQKSSYPVPKYPAKYKRSSRDIGVRPGSKVKENSPQSANFTRIYNFPAGLRLLVRVPCSKKLNRKELVDRAKSDSLPQGPPVQIDWETIRSDKVSFYAVTSTERMVVSFELEAKNGKYIVKDKKKNKSSSWDIELLTFPKKDFKTCVKEKDLTDSEVRKAVMNTLNNATLKNARKGPGS